jgi:Fe-S-cluster containining protein
METNQYESMCIKLVEKYKCKKCGLCCRNNNLFLTQDELKVICKKLKIKEESINIKNRHDNYLILNTPCPFLKGNVCRVHEFRPYICRIFPFSCRMSLQSLKTCQLSKEICEDIKLFLGKMPNTNSEKLIEDYKQQEKAISNILEEDKTLEKEISMIFTFPLIKDFFEYKK